MNLTNSTFDFMWHFLQKDADTMNYDVREPVVILGFGQLGQVLLLYTRVPSLTATLLGNRYHKA